MQDIDERTRTLFKALDRGLTRLVLYFTGALLGMRIAHAWYDYTHPPRPPCAIEKCDVHNGCECVKYMGDE